MNAISKHIAVFLLAVAASAMLTACNTDSFDAKNTGSGEQVTGTVKVKPCALGTVTIDEAFVECDVNGVKSQFVGAPLLLTVAIVKLMLDPLILEVPASAGGFTGYLTGGPLGLQSPLQITAGLASIPIDAKTTLVAEPGTQLVIVDVPAGYVANPNQSVSFFFHYIDLGHSPIKAIFAAKVPVGNTTYYPPLLPCVSDFANVSSVSFGALSLAQLTTLLGSVTPCNNKAYDFGAGPPPPAAANYQGIWWNAPANSESGWGVNLAHQNDTMFASWFTYDMLGRGWWLVMTANKTATNTYSGTLLSTRGPAFSAVPFDPNAVTSNAEGTGTLTFTDANNGSFHYVIGGVDQTKVITRQVFGTLPTCAYGTQPNLALATNYQDLWWAKPAGSESGWGINLNHEGDTIFATWFTYDLDGSPLWLVVSASKSAAGVYTGDLYRTFGARFDAFDATKVKSDKVGTATFTFADGNNASFNYTVQVAGMASPITQTKAITRELFSASGTACQ